MAKMRESGQDGNEGAVEYALDFGGDIRGRERAVDAEVERPGIAREDRAGELLVDSQAIEDNGFAIIFPGNEGRVVEIADASHARRLEQQVVDMQTGGALAARGDAPQNGGRRNSEVNGDGGTELVPGERAIEKFGLGQGAGIAVQQEAGRAVGCADALGDETVDDVIADETAARDDGAGEFAERRTGFALGTEKLAGRDGRDREAAGDELSLRTFATAGRAEQQNDHKVLPAIWKPVVKLSQDQE